MFGRLRMRPREIERLTETELALCLDDDLGEKRDPSGGEVMGPHDVVEYGRARRAMSVSDRLAHAKSR